MRVLLLNPPPAGKVTKEGRVIIPLNITFEVPRFPLTLAMIATTARRHGHEPMILDSPPGRRSFKRLRRALASFGPDLAIVNISTPTIETDRLGAAAARDAGSRVILFGQHAQALPAQSLRDIPEADAAVCGEPEPVLDAVFARLAEDGGRKSGIDGRLTGEGGSIGDDGVESSGVECSSVTGSSVVEGGGFTGSGVAGSTSFEGGGVEGGGFKVNGLTDGGAGNWWNEAISPGGILDPPPAGLLLKGAVAPVDPAEPAGAAPSPENDGNTAVEPVAGSSKPSVTEIGSSATPAAGAEISATPATEVEISATPATGAETSSTSATGAETSATPAIGVETSSTSATGAETSSTSATGAEISATPAARAETSSTSATEVGNSELFLTRSDRPRSQADSVRWSAAADLPLPARGLLPPARYRLPDGSRYTLVLASRGCPYACPFCLASPMNGRTHRSRSAAAVVEETTRVIKTEGTRCFLFQSDLFTADRAWVVDLCERLLASAPGVRWICNGRIDTLDRELLQLMAKAGCFLMSIGIESGDPGLLKAMHKSPDTDRIVRVVKDAAAAGIIVNGSFVVGFPGETEATLARTASLIEKLPLGFLVLMCATPFPGTSLYDRLLRENRLLSRRPEMFTFNRYNIESDVTLETVYKFINTRLRKFYLRPSYLAARLREAGRPRALCGYLSYGVRRGREITGAFPRK